MLETIASIAGLIGFSMQVFDKFSDDHPEKLGREMAALKSLSITGKTWKSIHSKYHAVDRNLSTLLSVTETVSNGRRETLIAEKVTAYHIREALENPNWQMYLETFEDELRPSIDTLRYANVQAKEKKDQVLGELRDKGLFDIAEKIHTIVLAQEKIVVIHDDFLRFISTLKDFVCQDRWGMEQSEFLIAHRVLLKTRIPSVIGSTDNALMAILDLYNLVIDDA